MGKRSIRENKNIYQLSRENAGLTREKASDLMDYISSDRIEKIESERSMPHPDEILAMSRCYKTPEMCNYYCSHECPIGQEYVPEVKVKDLSQIILEMLATLNSLNKEKERLIEITADGEISPDEYKDFNHIRKELGKIATSSDALQLWLEKTIASGKIRREMLESND